MGAADPRIGKPFPVAAFRQAEKPRFKRKELMRGRMPLTEIERHAISEEDQMIAAGFKGWTITIKYKDGKIEDIPLIAKDIDGAWAKARPQMHDVDNIHEIVIVDPKLGEILHSIGAGARRAAGAIARGLKKIPGIARRVVTGVRKAVVTSAYKTGRVMALPHEAKEAYQAGMEARQPLEEPAPPAAAPVERPPPPTTMEEWRGQSVPLYTRGPTAFEEPPSEVVHAPETGVTFVRRAKEKTSKEKELERDISLLRKEVTAGVLKRQKKRLQELEELEKQEKGSHGPFGKRPFGGKATSIKKYRKK